MVVAFAMLGDAKDAEKLKAIEAALHLRCHQRRAACA